MPPLSEKWGSIRPPSPTPLISNPIFLTIINSVKWFFTKKSKVYYILQAQIKNPKWMYTQTNTWHTLHMTKMTIKGKGKQKLIATLVHNKSIIEIITNIEVTGALIKC